MFWKYLSLVVFTGVFLAVARYTYENIDPWLGLVLVPISIYLSVKLYLKIK